jgi:hypothetical protein
MSPFAYRPSSALRVPHGDAADRSPAPTSPALLTPGAGEPVLTHGQRVALLMMRRSDWSKAILSKLKEAGLLVVSGDDFRSLVPLNLATAKGHSYHVPTSNGRWAADKIAMEIARDIGMHVVTYDFGGEGRGGFWKCTCGQRSPYLSRQVRSYRTRLFAGAKMHLAHVGAVAKRDVA